MKVAASAVLKEGDAGAFASFFVDRRCKLWRRLFQKVGSGSGSLNCILFSGAEPVRRFLSPRLFLNRAGLIL